MTTSRRRIAGAVALLALLTLWGGNELRQRAGAPDRRLDALLRGGRVVATGGWESRAYKESSVAYTDVMLDGASLPDLVARARRELPASEWIEDAAPEPGTIRFTRTEASRVVDLARDGCRSLGRVAIPSPDAHPYVPPSRREGMASAPTSS